MDFRYLQCVHWFLDRWRKDCSVVLALARPNKHYSYLSAHFHVGGEQKLDAISSTLLKSDGQRVLQGGTPYRLAYGHFVA